MKRLWLCVFLVLFSVQALAQSEQADLNASCNASFHKSCPAVASSSGFAAPVGVLGSSGLEAALVALLVAGGIGRRLYRRALGDGRKRGLQDGI